MSLFSQTEPGNNPAWFFRQAADYAVTAPFLALATVMCGSSVHSDASATVVFGLTFSFLIVSGLVLAIVALIGTHWYGREGIFRKAIAGVCIHVLFILWFAIGIAQLNRHVEARRMYQERMKQPAPTAH